MLLSFSDPNIFLHLNKRSMLGPNRLTETYILHHIISQWLDTDCLSSHISSILLCPHPCVTKIQKKIEEVLLKFERDEMFDCLLIEDIANTIINCYDPSEDNPDAYCPEMKSILKHMETSPLSPGYGTCSQ